MSSATYNLYSTLGPNVGIWYLQAQSKEASGQPVRLDADLVEVFCFLFPVKGGSITPSVVGSIASNRRWRSHPIECRPLPVHL